MKPWILTGSGAILASIALVFVYYWWLVPVGLASFFYSIWRLTPSRNSAFIQGLCFGTITAGASLWWWWNALPFDWIGITNVWEGACIMLIIWGLVSTVIGFANALVTPLMWEARRYAYAPVLFAILWLVSEWLRMWTFALLTYAPQSLLGTHFSATSFGYLLAEEPHLLAIAQIGGIYGLNLTVGLLAALVVTVYACVTEKNKLPHALTAGLALTLVGILLVPTLGHTTVHSTPPLSIALLHGSAEEKLTDPEVRDILLELAATSTPDIVLFPEEETLPSILTSISLADYTKLFGSKEVLLVAAGVRQTKTYERTESLVYMSTTRGVIGTYHKMFLMPEAEYNPLMSKLIFSLSTSKTIKDYFVNIASTVPGSETLALPYQGTIIGGMVCSDLLSPIIAADVGSKGAHIILDSSNPTWFRGSHLLHDRFIELGKVIAVSNNAYFILAAKGSPSFAIDPSGTVIAESGWGTTTPQLINIGGH